MPTRPHHDVGSILADARHLLAVSRAAENDGAFAERIPSTELDDFETSIKRLEGSTGVTSTAFQNKLAAGVHAAAARAVVFGIVANVRADAQLAFPHDKVTQHKFGVGATASPGSTAEVELLAHSLLAAAADDPASAAKVGLDAHGVHVFEDALHALEGAELAHSLAKTTRHSDATATHAQQHDVTAEVARIRMTARRLYKGDAMKLDAFAPTLPRYAITPKVPAATPPATPPAT